MVISPTSLPTAAGIGLIALVSLAAAFGQSAATPAFDLADVQAASTANSTPFMTGGVLRDGRYHLRNATMLDLITTAYGVDGDTVLGGPNWLEMDRFDVIATAPPATPPATVKLMLRTLLSDRFKLVIHKDMKPLPAFALTMGKGKPKLKQADDADSGCHARSAPDADPHVAPYVVVSCLNMTMDAFAQSLRGISSPYIGKPVIDQTGLQGTWDFEFKFTAWTPTPAQASSDAISVFDAIEKQLGLKLEPQKVSAPVLVVDSVNRKPTAAPPEVTRSLLVSPLAGFEVAVIKPSLPDTSPDLRFQAGGQVDIHALTLKTLIALAWNLDPDTNYMIAGAPKFLDSNRFDILAKPFVASLANAAPLDLDELRLLLQALLKDRFKLATHFEDRAVPAYTLVAVKPKLKKANAANRTRWKEGPGPDGKDPRMTNPLRSRLVSFQNVTAAQFADLLPVIASGVYLGPVLDGTGLDGSWDFTLSFSTAGQVRSAGRTGEAGQAAEPNGAVSIFDAVEKQLGLKLEMHKRPIPVLVIDHIEEKPTDN